jgi:hypothetical protein
LLDGGAGAHDECLEGETVLNCEWDALTPTALDNGQRPTKKFPATIAGARVGYVNGQGGPTGNASPVRRVRG